MALPICSYGGCDKVGTKKCAACRESFYCSVDHQRLHWKEHRTECKKTNTSSSALSTPSSSSSQSTSPSKVMDGTTKNSSPSSPAGPLGNPSAIAEKLIELHRQREGALRSRNFERAVSIAEQGLKMAQLLPEPMHSVETVKIHLDSIVAYQHMKKLEDANDKTKIALQKASALHESKQYYGEGGKRICDLYMNSCLCRAHFLLDTLSVSPVPSEPGVAVLTAEMKDKVIEAKSLGMKAQDLCRQLFPGDEENVNMFKPLRVLGLIKERLNDTHGAEKDIHSAYMCVVNAARRFIRSGGGGAGSGGTEARTMMLDAQQMLIDELIRTIMRRKDLKQVIKAEEYAQYDFDMVTKDRKFTNKELPYADSLDRLAKLQHNVPGKLALADENMTLVLKIRKAHYKDSTDKQNLLRIADTSVLLAKIREARDLLVDSTAELLSSAASIYNSCRDEVAKGKIGTPFPFINTIDADITRLSLLMLRRAKSSGAGSSSKDGNESATSKSEVTSTSIDDAINKNGKLYPSSLNKAKKKKRTTGEKYTFAPEDGRSRMNAATTLYKDEHYSDAVVILQEAVDIFQRLYGSAHPETEHAKNNLTLAINQELNCLWREVLEELE